MWLVDGEKDLFGQLVFVIQFQKCRITISDHKSEEVKVVYSRSLPVYGVTGVSGSNVGDMFIWMPKEHLYVLVYLVTVMHSMQAGYMDKAQKYTDKALMQIEKLKSTLFTQTGRGARVYWFVTC
jgi:hypothetical protein